MAQRSTLNISITPQLQKFLDEKLETGQYGSTSEIVREGLRLIQERDRLLDIEEIRAKIDVGWAESQRKEGRDGETVFLEMRKELQRRLTSGAPRSRKSS